jgi:hypothetical protein
VLLAFRTQISKIILISCRKMLCTFSRNCIPRYTLPHPKKTISKVVCFFTSWRCGHVSLSRKQGWGPPAVEPGPGGSRNTCQVCHLDYLWFNVLIILPQFWDESCIYSQSCKMWPVFKWLPVYLRPRVGYALDVNSWCGNRKLLHPKKFHYVQTKTYCQFPWIMFFSLAPHIQHACCEHDLSSIDYSFAHRCSRRLESISLCRQQ